MGVDLQVEPYFVESEGEDDGPFSDAAAAADIPAAAEVEGVDELDAADDAEAAVGRISVSASPHRKCERCWHWRADTGACPVHPALCARCMSNLYAEGEPRCCA